MAAALEGVYERLKDWARVWRLPRLPRQIRIEFSHRLRSALGRCHARQGLIRLNGILLLPENRQLLIETLCHEAAHVAAHQLHGARIKPHGAEWRALHRAAGLEPRATIPAHGVFGLKPGKRRGVVFEYHCPVCEVVSRARVRNSRYRCRACLKAGRPGVLTVVRRDPGDPAAGAA
jgi:SprT protein